MHQRTTYCLDVELDFPDKKDKKNRDKLGKLSGKSGPETARNFQIFKKYRYNVIF